jgi:riboflavin kinase / FMN adenylyltransferase
MRIHTDLDAPAGRLTRGAIAIGNFDGVHLGHRALFDAVRRHAKAQGGPSAALTFEPHPARLLAPEYAPPLIASPERKRELIAGAGIDDLIVQHFDRAFASTPPERFVELLLATGVSDVVIGHDFTYGKNRAGGVETLRAALGERGVHVHVVPAVTVNGLVVSSTKVREFTLEGRVEAATSLLGRPFDLDGDVVRGEGRGRKLGWPTANLRTTAQLLPAVGVYAVRARIFEGPADELAPRLSPPLAGAANLGLNPTFRKDLAQAAQGRSPYQNGRAAQARAASSPARMAPGACLPSSYGATAMGA